MHNPLRALLITSVISICLPICTQAHMQMSWPYPLRSPLDPEVSESLKDYSMTNPLLADGSDFSCKKYQYNDTNSQANDIKAVYQAGSVYNMSITGSATHLGGSCQISLSYDNGATFKVIESQIGGCSLVTTHNFTIPSYAPASDSVLLSWSWFNLMGNREMYQNCARVSIQNPSQNQPIPRYRRQAVHKERSTSLDDLPNMFVCNLGNGCTTLERSELVFPEPGDNVVYGTDAVTPSAGPGFKLASPSTVSAYSSSAASTSASSSSSASASSSSLADPAVALYATSGTTTVATTAPFQNITSTAATTASASETETDTTVTATETGPSTTATSADTSATAITTYTTITTTVTRPTATATITAADSTAADTNSETTALAAYANVTPTETIIITETLTETEAETKTRTETATETGTAASNQTWTQATSGYPHFYHTTPSTLTTLTSSSSRVTSYYFANTTSPTPVSSSKTTSEPQRIALSSSPTQNVTESTTTATTTSSTTHPAFSILATLRKANFPRNAASAPPTGTYNPMFNQPTGGSAYIQPNGGFAQPSDGPVFIRPTGGYAFTTIITTTATSVTPSRVR